jgi:thiol:disulfide interchange protein
LRRTSGVALLSACAALALGGWALYYVADDAARGWVSVTHWVLGLALPALLLAHVVGSRRERRARERAAMRPPGL